MRILAAQMNPTIGDIEGNTQKVLAALKRAQADIILFPELTLCGYFPDDLLLDHTFVAACEQKLSVIAPATKDLFVVVGLPRKSGREKPLFNSAAIFADGKLLGFKDKSLLPTYDVFDERRYFEPGDKEPIWEYKGKRIAVTICEDAWQHAHMLDDYTNYARDPIAELQGERLDLALNISGSPYSFQRKNSRLLVFQKMAQTLKCPVIFCNQVGANDQLIFDGHSMAVDQYGDLQQIAKGFEECDMLVDLGGQAHSIAEVDSIHDLFQALVLGVRDYFHKQGFTKAVLGLSGGVDSALVACIAKEALGAPNLFAITMPSRFSSCGSITDSVALAKTLGVEIQELGIDPIFQAYEALLKPEGITKENLQTRIRAMFLMAYSNQYGHLLLNTGNKSEMAMGYCTLYGDMAGALGVLHDVKKMQVYDLAKYVGLPDAIIQKVPSAELKENQTDFDTLPPYEVLDAIIEDYIEKRFPPEKIVAKRGYALEFVIEIIRKIHQNEYKRRQAPIGLRVTEKAFSKGRLVPIVQKWYS